MRPKKRKPKLVKHLGPTKPKVKTFTEAGLRLAELHASDEDMAAVNADAAALASGKRPVARV